MFDTIQIIVGDYDDKNMDWGMSWDPNSHYCKEYNRQDYINWFDTCKKTAWAFYLNPNEIPYPRLYTKEYEDLIEYTLKRNIQNTVNNIIDK